MKAIVSLLLLWGVSNSLHFAFCQSGDQVTPSIKVTTIGSLDTIQTGFSFTEGPAVDKQGNVFFTDQPNDRIYRWDAVTEAITVFLEGAGRANGMAFDQDGYLIACADMHGELWKIAPDGSHEVLINHYNGKLLNGPNDLWINPLTGDIYLTDPLFPRAYWNDDDPRKQAWPPTHSEQAETGKGGHVYYLAPESKALIRVTEGWDADAWPNGIVGTPDGKKLYVNKWAGGNMGGIWVFDIMENGTLSLGRKFSDTGGDGMSMDELGNIYISNASGVVVLDPNGNQILTIDPGGGATNNVFAGQDGKTLFITGPTDRVTKVQMNVSGVEKF
ncbi:MAG TPA: SMP-30/gluconolactonase/LRE family protein [Saprospiraceae bacterium]|nr:SMP-30/gluconolactonase/LRE family protein [Saprospiraceae bacterium]HMQ81453.1 SMP-30/gluconolactonase/LRE family protein [Saprospiraceae bacterium]